MTTCFVSYSAARYTSQGAVQTLLSKGCARKLRTWYLAGFVALGGASALKTPKYSYRQILSKPVQASAWNVCFAPVNVSAPHTLTGGSIALVAPNTISLCANQHEK